MASVYLSLPPSSLFQFPPSSEPISLPPPTPGSTLSAPPFSIPASLYVSALDIKVPITIACVYATVVISVNRYNKSAGNKAWGISKTKPFFWFVVAHNVFLAVYSAWTFWGMLRALTETLQGFNGANGLASTVDSLCKIHGPRGLGNAVTYNSTYSAWTPQSPNVLLNAANTPYTTDLGRLWNEGLSFYGWFFYLSKFYEVLDTFIILAKGKRSSTLQTYHHAGAMLCMWAGIRYMSPPIWMFVFVNSFIHALMYTYYTLTAFSVPIPNRLKRSLTTLQIIQFLVGSTYAAIHSFVSYTIPTTVPIYSASSPSAAPLRETDAAGLGSILKKYLYRAAGEEGLAENLATGSSIPQSVGSEIIGHATEWQSVPCIDTSGQTFAIWLNVLYLAPLTVLFVRFFIRSYIKRVSGTQPKKIANGSANGSVNGTPNGKKTNGYANGHANGHAKNGKAK